MKKIVIALSVFIVLAAAYVGLWLSLKNTGDDALSRLMTQAKEDGVIYNGAPPTVEGFPFIPFVTLTDGIRVDDVQASFPEMTLRGFPIPGFPVTLDFPHGVIAWQEGERAPVAFDTLEITARIPWPLPKGMDEDSLRAWRDGGGAIAVTDSLIRYEGMETRLAGDVFLDGEMQPAAELTARTKGYAAFIQTLINDDKIKPFAGIALIAALNNFAAPSPDVDDGEMVAALPVTVQNRGIYVGPVLVETLRPIVWDTPQGRPAP